MEGWSECVEGVMVRIMGRTKIIVAMLSTNTALVVFWLRATIS